MRALSLLGRREETTHKPAAEIAGSWRLRGVEAGSCMLWWSPRLRDGSSTRGPLVKGFREQDPTI